MKARLFYIILLIISSIQVYSQSTADWNYDTTYYFYAPDSNAENIVTTKVYFNSKITKEAILDSIAFHLSNTYFIPRYYDYEDTQKIKIEIKKVTEIDLSDSHFLIATVNINDPDKICMATYFQGSSGGRITFLMLVANLMQPQLMNPLLEGIVFTYNGEELGIMDHINLEGIISEREIESMVRKSIKNQN